MVAFFLLTAFLCVIIFEPLPLTTDFFFLLSLLLVRITSIALFVINAL